MCSDPSGLTPAQLALPASGKNLGVATLSLSRSILKQGAASAATTTDSGLASFFRYTPEQVVRSNFGQAASPGTCMVFPIYGTADVVDPIQPSGLDAGSTVQVGGTNGTIDLKPINAGKGLYGTTLGSGSSGPFFLDVPGHTFNVYGGVDIGVFAEEVRMPPPLVWTNQDAISTVSVSQGLKVAWSNAVPNGWLRISGYSLSTDQNGKPGVGASFFCTADAGPNGSGDFTIPPAVLISLPLSRPSSASVPAGFLGIAGTRTPSDALSGIRGIDVGFVSTSWQVAQNVTYVK
jgi:hypothetical protein